MKHTTGSRRGRVGVLPLVLQNACRNTLPLLYCIMSILSYCYEAHPWELYRTGKCTFFTGVVCWCVSSASSTAHFLTVMHMTRRRAIQRNTAMHPSNTTTVDTGMIGFVDNRNGKSNQFTSNSSDIPGGTAVAHPFCS